MNQGTWQAVFQLSEKVHQANHELIHIWQSEMLFRWEWWVEAAISVVPWILWAFYRKRESTSRLVHAGIWVIVMCSWLDFLGVCLGLWVYPMKLIPTIPSFVAYDFTLVPVVIMTLLQYRPQWSPLLKACIFAAATSFLGEPLFIWLKMYEPIHWKHIYSFPIYAVIYLIAHFVSHAKTYDPL